MMYDMNQYAKDSLYRTQQLQAAQQLHLAEMVQAKQQTSFNVLHIGRKAVITISLFIVFISFLMLLPETIHASDKSDPGGADAFYDQMIAYRLGHYYYVTGEYERAVDYYNRAIDGIPESVLGRISSFRDIYWYKGDAQLKAGQSDAALVSYQYYLQLADNEAKPKEIEFVNALKTSMANGNVAMEPLEL